MINRKINMKAMGIIVILLFVFLFYNFSSMGKVVLNADYDCGSERIYKCRLSSLLYEGEINKNSERENNMGMTAQVISGEVVSGEITADIKLEKEESRLFKLLKDLFSMIFES